MKTLGAAGLAVLALIASGCGLSISLGLPSPTIPSVGVNVVNQISNVVVTGDLFSHAVGTGSELEPQFVAPCGGTLSVRAFEGNVGGGALTLYMGMDESLDRGYADEPNVVLANLSDYNLGIMWSEGNLEDGDWIVVTPTEVTISKTEPPALAPGAVCQPWAYEEE